MKIPASTRKGHIYLIYQLNLKGGIHWFYQIWHASNIAQLYKFCNVHQVIILLRIWSIVPPWSQIPEEIMSQVHRYTDLDKMSISMKIWIDLRRYFKSYILLTVQQEKRIMNGTCTASFKILIYLWCPIVYQIARSKFWLEILERNIILHLLIITVVCLPLCLVVRTKLNSRS